jgi:hypothetical protein
MLERAIQTYLSTRRVAVGETVQCGWLILWVTELGPPIRLESLDFMRMASFTADLSRAEVIYREQQAMLRRHGVEEELCTISHSAIVSRSYNPGHPDAFLKRDAAVEGHSSGWYVGVTDDPLSMEDPSTFELRSLYELSISDPRMIPFWLMPVGTTAFLADGAVFFVGNGVLALLAKVPDR